MYNYAEILFKLLNSCDQVQAAIILNRVLSGKNDFFNILSESKLLLNEVDEEEGINTNIQNNFIIKNKITIRKDINDTIIKTPIDGYIIGKPKEVGTTISSGISEPQVIMNVATLDRMQIEVLVDESDIGQVQQGQKVKFSVDAYPDETFTGVVRLISRSATTSNNVIYYKVYVDVNESKGKLLPTMTARTDIVINEAPNALMVPLNCIWSEGGRKFVKVINKQTKEVKEVDVKLGLSGDTEIQVTAEGLKKGDVLLVKKAVAKQNNAKNFRPRL